MSELPANKYRAAIQVLQRGRELLVESIADEILDQADDLLDGGYAFNELLEGQGTRLHFLCLLVSQLEQSAEQYEEAQAAARKKPAPRKRRSRSKKLAEQASKEGSPEEL